MRFAVKYLAAVVVCLVIVVGIWLGVAVVRERGEVRLPDDESRREVYVDVSRLVKEHPGWEALEATRSAMADARSAGRGLPSGAGTESVSLEVPVAREGTPVPRDYYEAEAAAQAEEALEALEAEQRAALRTRMDVSRRTMSASAESDIRLKAREIEREAADSIRAVGQKYSHGWLAAEMKAAALRSALGQPGRSEDEVKAKLGLAESELSSIKNTRESEISKIEAETKNRVEELRREANAKIDAALNVYSDDEIGKIEKRVLSAGKQIMSEVDSFASPSGEGRSSAINGPDMSRVAMSARLGRNVASPRQRYAGSLRAWREETEALEERIENQVSAKVRELAEGRGVKVVFSRAGEKVPDETEVFAELMRKSVLLGPVIGERGGI